MKAVDRRYGDVEKRLQRKTQVLELTRKGVESARTEIDAARAWVADKLRELQELPPLGTTVRAAEERQQALKALSKEAEGKQVLLDSLTKRVDGMKAELEPSELAALESSLRSLEAEQADLRGQLRSLTAGLASSLEARRTLETGLEDARAWVRTRLTDLQRLGDKAPLKAAKVEREIQQFQVSKPLGPRALGQGPWLAPVTGPRGPPLLMFVRLPVQQAEKDAEHFGKTTLMDVTNQGQTLLKDCAPADKQKLLDSLQGTYPSDRGCGVGWSSLRLVSLGSSLSLRSAGRRLRLPADADVAAPGVAVGAAQQPAPARDGHGPVPALAQRGRGRHLGGDPRHQPGAAPGTAHQGGSRHA